MVASGEPELSLRRAESGNRNAANLVIHYKPQCLAAINTSKDHALKTRTATATALLSKLKFKTLNRSQSSYYFPDSKKQKPTTTDDY
jgi:hypothetical protein